MPSGSGSGSGSAAAVVPLTAEQKVVRATYRLAMRHGRKATDAKAYAEAIAAFDEAVKARPTDPRALAERGFAKLLAGTDLESASADFDHAADQTRDPKILGMIWFNRGLVDDKLGHPDAALVDYFLANKLSPSKAAAGKLAGKQVCPIRLDSDRELGTAAPIDAADWLALGTALPDGFQADAHPKTSAESHALILNGAKDTGLPTTIIVGEFNGKNAYLVDKHGKGLRAVLLGGEVGGRCSGSVDFAIAGVQGDLVHVRGTEQVGGGMSDMCVKTSTPHGPDAMVYASDMFVCTGAADEDSMGTACFNGPPTLRDLVIDRSTGKRVIIAEQEVLGDIGPAAQTTVQAVLAPDGLHLSGLDCDQVVPRPRAK